MTKDPPTAKGAGKERGMDSARLPDGHRRSDKKHRSNTLATKNEKPDALKKNTYK